MYKFFLNRVIKSFLSILLFLCFFSFTFSAEIQKRNIDTASIQWSQRPDVKEAAKKLVKVHEEVQEFIQKVYNAYAPYTIGEGHIMRKRMKTLSRLIKVGEIIEGLYLHYCLSMESNLPYDQKMSKLKRSLSFYYFDQEVKEHIPWMHTTIISEFDLVLKTLCNSQHHPDFVRVTHFDKNEATQLLMTLEKAIHAAVSTIPGGSEILAFK